LKLRSLISKVFILLFIGTTTEIAAQKLKPWASIVPVDSGWARNSINTVPFRKNSLVSAKGFQFISFYNQDGEVVVGRRKLGTVTWTLQTTRYKGATTDAHNAISIMVDGEGYLHLAWNHHNSPLMYCKSTSPLSLEFGPMTSMTGKNEERITYPEFHLLKNGNLLFFYRDGRSGSGKLAINQYDVKTRLWSSVSDNLIDGETHNNPYWQASIDPRGTIHISWVWRGSYDVSSNHDLCYARSDDNGKTWEKSTGEKYVLPITESTAEYAWKIPKESELINQTSMTTDVAGNPFIATYWRNAGNEIPQYHIVYKSGGAWQNISLNFRSTPFRLAGGGTKRIPIARPQVFVTGKGKDLSVIMVFRDEERKHRVSALIMKNLSAPHWDIVDLTNTDMGSWEPTYDIELWNQKKIIDLFIQHVEQADAEGLVKSKPQMISVLEWNPAHH
jgi:BNR repeat-containing family member